MRPLFITFICLAGLAQSASACPYTVRTYAAPVYYAQSYSYAYAYPVLVPTYSISFQPPAPVMPPDPLVKELEALRADVSASIIQQLRGARNELRKGPATETKPNGENVPPPDAAQPVTLGSVIGGKCIKCHGANDPKAGLSLVDASGNLPTMSVADKNRIKRRIATSSMPPPESGLKLSEAEKKVFESL